MRAIHSLDKKITVIIIAHRLTTLKNCDQILRFHDDHLTQILSYEDLIKLNQVYGSESKIAPNRKIPVKYVFLNPYDFIAKDDLGKKSINFGVYGIPESILINNELVILQKYIGPLTNEDYNKILKTIN